MVEPDLIRAHVRLLGRVQGVGFRYWTQQQARRLGVSGWVRNLDSGGVEAVFEGSRPAVESIVRWCQEGPRGAHVRDLRVGWDEPAENFETFEIESTFAD